MTQNHGKQNKRETGLLLALATAMASIAMSPNIANANVIADSVADFSATTQGQKGWSYGYLNTPGDTSTFTLLDSVHPTRNPADTLWQISAAAPPWVVIWADGQHSNGANSGPELWSDRRWESNVAGTVTVSGVIGRQDNGDTMAKIFRDGIEIFSFNTSTLGRSEETTYSIQTTLLLGSRLDFALSPNGNDFSDSTKFTANIAAVPLPPSAWLFASALLGLGFRKKPTLKAEKPIIDE